MPHSGSPGPPGLPGKSYEYIFALSSSSLIPKVQYPMNNWAFDRPRKSGGARWHDAAPAPTAKKPYLWTSHRDVDPDYLPVEVRNKLKDWEPRIPKQVQLGAWSAPLLCGKHK